MANPIKAVKAVTRAVAGITGKGGKNVNPVYNEPIKINSNPNKTPAKGARNPTQVKLENEEMLDPWYDKYGSPPTQTIKINSNKRGN